mmetsp:Transcript_23536/g.70318  ORF Transcript_23536/g.70318 Transcript_23536/m.70318 type:complete len:206 (+) Transcript_23536:453-1070(+)
MPGLLDRIHEHVKCLVVVLHARCEATLITNVAGVLSVLLLDDALQIVVDLGADDHRLLEGRGTHGQYHELLASQAVPGMAAAVDDVEGGHRHDVLLRGPTREVGDVLVERHVHRGGARATDCHGHSKDGVGPQVRLGPAPVILGAVEGLHHQLVDLLLLGDVQADELRRDDCVHVLHGLEHALAQEPAPVAVAHLQRLVDARGGA